MDTINEILIEKLAIESPSRKIDFLIDRINANIDPPKEVTVDNVNMRVMYIVNDRINSHGGRFRREDLSRICELLIDTAVLVGHNRSDAPLARSFHAELEERDSALWVKSYFYWPKAEADQGDPLLDKIDSGIFKECSISFTYSIPECSACGQDIRNCPHEIGQDTSGRDNERVHFIYGGISQILETSLVYKGSVKGTFLSDRLSDTSASEVSILIDGRRMDLRIDTPNPNQRAVVVPLNTAVKAAPEILSHSHDISCALGYYNSRTCLLVRNMRKSQPDES